jgi:catalase
MQMAQFKGRANYEPNSLSEAGEHGGPRECPQTGFKSFPEPVQGEKLRVRAESFADHYSQARMFFRSMHPAEQAHIASAFVFELSKVNLMHVRKRMVSNLRNVDEQLATRVAKGLGMELPEASTPAAPVQDLAPSPALRIIGNMKDTLEGRVVGALIADGSDAGAISALKRAVESAGGQLKLIAPKVGGVKLGDGSSVDADGQLAGTPSATVDAVALILTEQAATALCNEAAAVQFVMDAFGHLKAIGYTDGCKVLLDKAGVVPDDGVVKLSNAFVDAAKQRYFAREPKVRTLA